MKKSRFTDEQIVRILQAAAAGTVAQAARDHGVTEHTIYRWRKKYSGMEASDVRELKRLRDENQRLKRMLADRDLELEVMREIQEKKL
jgi:putative transposase